MIMLDGYKIGDTKYHVGVEDRGVAVGRWAVDVGNE
jgi:hypothetical protein